METHDFNKTDHDILITLVENVKNNHTTILDKIDGVKNDVSEIKENVSMKIADHEIRIRSLEKLRDEIKPESMVEILLKNEKWISEYKITWKLMLTVASIIAGVVGFLLSTLADYLKLFGK